MIEKNGNSLPMIWLEYSMGSFLEGGKRVGNGFCFDWFGFTR